MTKHVKREKKLKLIISKHLGLGFLCYVNFLLPSLHVVYVIMHMMNWDPQDTEHLRNVCASACSANGYDFNTQHLL